MAGGPRGPSRRATLAYALCGLASLAGCSGQGSGSASPSLPATTNGAQPTAVSPEPAPSPTTIGLRRELLQQGAPGTPEWSSDYVRAVGPGAVVEYDLAQGRAFSIHSPAPYRVDRSPRAGQTAEARIMAVDHQDDGETVIVDVILASSAGSGLQASKMVLSTTFWTEGVAGDVVDLDVEHPDGELEAVELSHGVACVAISFRASDDEQTPLIQRLAFDTSGAVRWSRVDPDNFESGIQANADEIALPTLKASDLLANGLGQFICGVDDMLHGVDPATGTSAWTAKGQYSNGVGIDGADVFALEAYGNGGYGEGYAPFSKADGRRLETSPVRSMSVDPVSNVAVLAFTVDEGGGPNDASDDGKSPALRTMRLPSGDEVYSLSRAAGKDLGSIDVLAAFDGRAVLRITDGLRVVSATTGEPEVGFETIAPGTFNLYNVPILSSAHWALLGSVGHSGLPNTESIHTLVYSDEPLTWADLGVSLEPPTDTP